MAKLCNNCGKESMDDVLFCTGCGADLQAQAQQAAPQQAEPQAQQNGEDLDFDLILQKMDSLQDPSGMQVDFSDERLDAMNKNLPSWNLEPPYSYLNKK